MSAGVIRNRHAEKGKQEKRMPEGTKQACGYEKAGAVHESCAAPAYNPIISAAQ